MNEALRRSYLNPEWDHVLLIGCLRLAQCL
jgi:hypothetical protein